MDEIQRVVCARQENRNNKLAMIICQFTYKDDRMSPIRKPRNPILIDCNILKTCDFFVHFEHERHIEGDSGMKPKRLYPSFND